MVKNHLLSKVATGLLLMPLLALTACTENAAPDEVDWEVVSTTEIVAIDDSSGIYVSGSMFNTDSESVIDYKYAHELSSGGVRQAMISDLWETAAPGDWEYPGAKAVTIHQDIDEDSTDKARIEVLKCSPPEPESEESDPLKFFAPGIQCTMPDGTPMGSTKHRIDIHVPKGSVVDADSLAPKETTP